MEIGEATEESDTRRVSQLEAEDQDNARTRKGLKASCWQEGNKDKGRNELLRKRLERRKEQLKTLRKNITFNNTLVTLTDMDGNISWSSAGSNGFRGSRESRHLYPLHRALLRLQQGSYGHGLKIVEVYVKGPWFR